MIYVLLVTTVVFRCISVSGGRVPTYPSQDKDQAWRGKANAGGAVINICSAEVMYNGSLVVVVE